MSEFSPNPQLPITGLEAPSPGTEVVSGRDRERRLALVHVLTPEFQGLNPEDFEDIPEEVVARASASELQPSLFWPYIKKGNRSTEEVSTFSYQTPDGNFVSVAMTPEEYDACSESVEKLALRVFNRVLTQRDAALRKETGDESSRARSDEDIRAARRGGMRVVMEQKANMECLLNEGILPKVELIKKFMEMASGRNANLARGTTETLGARVEELRTTVFDDMLDAVALKRGWTADMALRAKRIIQKRMYLSGTVGERIINFHEMSALALEYYGHKRALLLTKSENANKYMRANPEVVADIVKVDEERRLEKETRQLQFEAGK